MCIIIDFLERQHIYIYQYIFSSQKIETKREMRNMYHCKLYTSYLYSMSYQHYGMAPCTTMQSYIVLRL